jgi:hypothetical protein
MNGFVGLFPLSLQRPGKIMYAESFRNLSRGSAALVAGWGAFTAKIRK